MTDQIINFLAQEKSHWIIAIALLAILIPFERLFPKIPSSNLKPKLLTILIVAVTTYTLVWLFKNYTYRETILFLLQFQVFSLAKTPLSDVALFAVSFLFIDFLMYLSHFLSHRINALWRLHSVHHSDEHVTALSGLLHHPLESIFSYLFVLTFSVIFGIPLLVLIIFAAVGAVASAVTHSNIAVPKKLDSILRWIFVTPDVHRTHHSIKMDEGNSNYGLVFTIWDRIFRTYTPSPAKTEEGIEMGLPASEKPKSFTASALLLHPFAKMFQK